MTEIYIKTERDTLNVQIKDKAYNDSNKATAKDE